MRLAVIGVGQAGGKVLDRLLEFDRRWGGGFITSATAINTARTDLHGLELVPVDRRVLIGQTKTHGHGVGADNELAAEIAKRDEGEILGAVDGISLGDTEAFLIVAGLGGGTGSGAGPVIARLLRDIYQEPVYALGIFPSRDEGGLYSLNAARSLKTYVQETDATLMFDNEAWRAPGETIEAGYARMNEELARRFGVLFSVGEITPDGVGESVVDASEIHRTLEGGGLATVGYAADAVKRPARGLLARFRTTPEPEVPDDTIDRVAGLVRTATRGRLTAPVTVNTADRALLVVSGPPDKLSRRGAEEGRRWLEREADTTEVRGGDQPIRGQNQLAATVVLAGVTEVTRIRELQAIGNETRLNEDGRSEKHDRDLQALMTDEFDALDTLI